MHHWLCNLIVYKLYSKWSNKKYNNYGHNKTYVDNTSSCIYVINNNLRMIPLVDRG